MGVAVAAVAVASVCVAVVAAASVFEVAGGVDFPVTVAWAVPVVRTARRCRAVALTAEHRRLGGLCVSLVHLPVSVSLRKAATPAAAATVAVAGRARCDAAA